MDGAVGHPPFTAQQMQQQQQMQQIKAEEAAQEQANLGKRKHAKWKFLTRQESEENSPSKKDGLDPNKEAKWRREYMQVINKAGVTLKIPQWGIATAALLCHRFFSRKSMKRNDRFVIAAACLHLAAKMVEAPKPIREVVRTCEQIRHVRNKAVLQRLHDPAYMEEAKENVLMGERAVLYTLGFDLNVEHPYTTIMQELAKLGLLNSMSPENPYRHLMQNTWNFINDSFRTTLCIQFPPQELAFAALYLASELNKAQHGKGIEDMIRSRQPDADFFTYFQVKRAAIEAISHQILELYEEAKGIAKPEPTPAAGLGPGSNGTAAGGTPGLPRVKSESNGAGAMAGAGVGGLAGQKRKAEGDTGGQGASQGAQGGDEPANKELKTEP